MNLRNGKTRTRVGDTLQIYSIKLLPLYNFSYLLSFNSFAESSNSIHAVERKLSELQFKLAVAPFARNFQFYIQSS